MIALREDPRSGYVWIKWPRFRGNPEGLDTLDRSLRLAENGIVTIRCKPHLGEVELMFDPDVISAGQAVDATMAILSRCAPKHNMEAESA